MVYRVHKTFHFNAIIHKKMVLRATIKETFLSKLVETIAFDVFRWSRCICVVWMMVCTEHAFTAVCMWPLYTSAGHWIKCNMKSPVWKSKVKVSRKGWFYCFNEQSCWIDQLVLFCSIAGFQRFARWRNKSVKTQRSKVSGVILSYMHYNKVEG